VASLTPVPHGLSIYICSPLNTQSTPVLELAKILSTRGHTIDFVTLEGWGKWADDYPFISHIHIMEPGPSEEVLEARYLRMRAWDIRKGLGPVMDSKYMFDSDWTLT
jgi:hypothetical protein